MGELAKVVGNELTIGRNLHKAEVICHCGLSSLLVSVYCFLYFSVLSLSKISHLLCIFIYLFIYLFIRVLMQFVSVGNIGSAANLS